MVHHQWSCMKALTSNLAMVGLSGLRNGTISNSTYTRQGDGALILVVNV